MPSPERSQKACHLAGLLLLLLPLLLGGVGAGCARQASCARVFAREQRECGNLRAPAARARCNEAIQQRFDACRQR